MKQQFKTLDSQVEWPVENGKGCDECHDGPRVLASASQGRGAEWMHRQRMRPSQQKCSCGPCGPRRPEQADSGRQEETQNTTDSGGPALAPTKDHQHTHVRKPYTLRKNENSDDVPTGLCMHLTPSRHPGKPRNSWSIRDSTQVLLRGGNN